MIFPLLTQGQGGRVEGGGGLGVCVCHKVTMSRITWLRDSPCVIYEDQYRKKTMLRLRGLRNLVDIDMGPDIEINIKIDL